MTSRLAPAAARNRREARENLSACEGRVRHRPRSGSGAQQHHPRRRVRTGVTPCTRTDIKMMDGAITTAIKRAYGLPTSGRRSRTRTQINGEWACRPSRLNTPHATQHCPESLQDKGRLGVVTRTHGEATARPRRRRGHTAADPWHARHRMRVRQHAITTSRPLHQNKRPQYTTTFTTVLETIKGSTRGAQTIRVLCHSNSWCPS
jgi:hypothetical protein